MKNLEKLLKQSTNKKDAEILQRFFKTGKGQYGEGDIFLGIRVPIQRKIAKQTNNLTIQNIQSLLDSKIHEKRLIALFLLIERFNKAEEKDKEFLFKFYLKNAKRVNNWDLVDLSAPNIVGKYLLHKNKEREILYKLANSNNLWEKRISIISTLTFIRNHQFSDTLKISKILLKDKHDLMHKAVGWMLRELGKRNIDLLKKFLRDNYKNLPRTTLRYAIEKFPEDERKKWLKGEM
jgi:3-methyladenine DNA glycosylase AlkD